MDLVEAFRWVIHFKLYEENRVCGLFSPKTYPTIIYLFVIYSQVQYFPSGEYFYCACRYGQNFLWYYSFVSNKLFPEICVVQSETNVVNQICDSTFP